MRKDYDAVLIATGFHVGRSTRVPGTEHEDVFQAIDLLSKITRGEEIKVDEKIVVIGGGNVAMDIARSLARKQREKYGKVDLTVTSLESRDIMPADEEEIIESMEEGIVFHPGWGPVEIKMEEGKIKGLKAQKCLSIFDDEHRFSPKFDTEDILFMEATMVVESIGQGPDMSYLGEYVDNLEMDGRRIKVSDYYQSSLDWLFVAGDIIKGPDVITGIAVGHQAALGIDSMLNGAPEQFYTTIFEVLDTVLSFEEKCSETNIRFKNKFSEEVNRAISDIVDSERDHRNRISILKENPNVLLHLDEKLKRPQEIGVVATCLQEDPLPDDISVELYIKDRIKKNRIAFGFYNDLLNLTKNKELEFLFSHLKSGKLRTQDTLNKLLDEINS